MLRVSIKHFFLIAFLFVLFWPQYSLAADPPNLISPTDNSNESKSPKLTWQYSGECVQSGSCFLIEVDNSSDFSSPEKSTYTNNFSYSPQGIEEGLWHWRVKAKDKSEKWSDWSKVFKFTISQSNTNSPSPLGSPKPSAEAVTPQPTISSQKTDNIFSIKDIPTEINSDQEFEISISLKLSDKPNSTFYLKGAFKKEGSSNYFGQTLVGNEWVGNSEKYSKQLKITTDSSGNWEGEIKVKPDPEDSGFKGTGDYIFKIARYSDTGSGPIWSNELTIKINAVDIAQPPLSPSEEPEEITENDEGIDLTASLVKIPPKNYEIRIASVAGEATKSDNITLEEQTRVLEEKKINWLLIFLGMGILIGGAGYTFFKFRSSPSSPA